MSVPNTLLCVGYALVVVGVTDGRYLRCASSLEDATTLVAPFALRPATNRGSGAPSSNRSGLDSSRCCSLQVLLYQLGGPLTSVVFMASFIVCETTLPRRRHLFP